MSTIGAAFITTERKTFNDALVSTNQPAVDAANTPTFITTFITAFCPAHVSTDM